jgi:hypothetical protein
MGFSLPFEGASDKGSSAGNFDKFRNSLPMEQFDSLPGSQSETEGIFTIHMLFGENFL